MSRTDTPPRLESRSTRLVLICFFLSGMTALIYEIIWMRMLSRVIGGAPFAVSTILVVFMGAMGLGSFVASRRADRVEETKLVRIYGALELAVGIYALLVPVLLLLLKPLYASLYDALIEHTLLYNLSIFGGALTVLSLPAVCMGATLPILCRFYVSKLSHLGTHAGRLYGLNTIGAAVGSLLCGFCLIQSLGVWRTVLVAVAVNCAIGMLCLSIRLEQTSKVRRSASKAATASREAGTMEVRTTGDRRVLSSALVIFAVSGFCAMAYEVLWTKLLGLIVAPTTYSFTIVLVTFIVGLALGNLVFGRLADKTKNAIGLLAITQIAAALLALAVSQILGNSQLFFAKLIYTLRNDFALLMLAKATVLFAFMLAPALLLGATFPLVAKIYTRSVAAVGRSVGVAYAVNTVGAVLGSFSAGFLLVPLLGKENGLRVVISLQIATALVASAVALRRNGRAVARWGALAATLVAGIVLCAQYPSWNRQLLATGRYHRFEETTVVEEMLQSTGWIESLFRGPGILAASERGELVYYGDGIGGFTTVSRYPGPFGIYEFSMANSGKMDASSRGDMKTQTLLAHFPMLFVRAPEHVMVLGLASGVTPGEVLHYPIEELDVVEINDAVLEASRFFEPWNNNVLSNPRSRLIVQDGMAHLALTGKSYDVIISEPSNPWMAGMAALFTRDFFELVKKKLTDEGIYVQWFHCYQMNWDTFAMVGRTFAEVFPRSLLVSAEPGGLSRDFLLVGLAKNASLNWDRARENIEYAQRSTNIELAYPELFYRMVVSEDLERLFGDGPINTEDRPLLEYAAPRLMYAGEKGQRRLLEKLVGRAWLSPETRRASQRLRESVDSQIDFARYALSVYSPFVNMVELERANTTQKGRFFEAMESYAARNPIEYSLFGDPDLVRQLRGVQISAIEERVGGEKIDAVAYFYLARLYVAEGRRDEAIASYREAVRLDPDDAQSHNDLGFLLFEKGDVEEASSHYREAVRIRPNFVLALGNLAFAELRRGRIGEALHYFRETLRVRPDLAESQYYVGRILYEQARISEAVIHLEEAIRIDPDLVEALNILAWILATADDDVRDPKRAVEHARRGTFLTGEEDPVLLSTLAVAYAAAEEYEASRKTAGEALRVARAAGREDIVKLVQDRIPNR